MTREQGLLAALVLSLSVVCPPAHAGTNALESGMLKCAAEPQQAARLSCFDALVTTLPKVRADEVGMNADIARKRQAAATAAAASQASSSAATAQQPPLAAPAAPTSDKVNLPAKIIGLRQAPNGELIFTLDNSQVWIQEQVESSKRFSVGDAVSIQQGIMGNFWLAADKARKTKVKRIS